MHRNNIILASALIIVVFALLFIIENPQKPPKSEIDNVISEYKGEKGFVILSMPRFLISDVLFNGRLDSLEKGSNIHAVDLMIFHERDKTDHTAKSVMGQVKNDLSNLEFQRIDSIKTQYTSRFIFHKVRDNGWNESVLIFNNNDSSLFLFDVINNMADYKIVALADSINTDEIKF